MNSSWTHFTLDRQNPAYWRVTFNHPPINTITATTVRELSELVDWIERDPQLNVVVFGSANPDFFLAHYDVEKTRLVGRGRALEILLVADDFDGPRAAQYGYVNRVVADDELEDEVEEMAARLARFDREAIARTKSYVDQITLPRDSELPPALTDFRQAFGGPGPRARLAKLEELGLNSDSDLERHLGRRVVEADPLT